MGRVTEIPDLAQERRLWQVGYRRVAGLDEAGRGALAGPVVAAAVVVPPGTGRDGVWSGVRDSKALSATVREELAPQIQAAALAWGVGSSLPLEIDAMGIAPATRIAMQRALAALDCPADYLLIDWVRLTAVNLPQLSLVRGDGRVVSIAAASILAKVQRDRLLRQLAEQYPRYGFAHHKGYATADHLAALARYGPSPMHRRSFAPMAGDRTLFDPPHE